MIELVAPSIDVPAEQQAWIRGKQIAAYKGLLPYGLLASAVNSLVVVAFCWSAENSPGIWIWAAIMGFIAITSLPVVFKTVRSRNIVRERSAGDLVPPFRDSTMLGLGWAAAPFLLLPTATPIQEMVILVVCVGMMCGGAYMLSTVPRASAGLVVSMASGLAFGFLQEGGTHNWTFACLLVIYTFIMVRSAYWNYGNYLQTWLQQFELEQKSDVISLLLKDFEDTASDCLWEINKQGQLQNVSKTFAERLSQSTSGLEGTCLISLMNSERTKEENKSIEKLKSALKRHAGFRDVVVPIVINGQKRWWSMAGKPTFKDEEHVGFRGVITDITTAYNAESNANYLARFDTLTDIPNRKSFAEQLELVVSQHNQRSGGFAIFCIDLDAFKSINDIHGHPVGDAILRIAATRMSRCLDENGSIFRLGGDEFVGLQKSVASEDDTLELAGQLVLAMSEPFEINGFTIQSGISVGIALSPLHSSDPDELFNKADLALYRAKKDGRGRACLFEAEMDVAVRERREMEMDLRRALSEQQFCLNYQPLVDSKTLKPKAFEALLRWDHPEKGRIGPDRFIPLAEETKLIIPIGEWIIREAFEEAARWPDDINVSINLSPHQIKSSNLIPSIVHSLARTGLNPNRVEMEITESVLLEESVECMNKLHAIHSLGIKISLDDFGTGYSSMSYLQKFDFDKIKIDQSFVGLIEESDECAAIVKSIVGLAQNLGIRITAEGVENEAQIEAMIAEGCNELQGYYFSKPKSAEELQAIGLLDRQNPIVEDDEPDEEFFERRSRDRLLSKAM